jgi:general secretion pathway protein B
MSFILDALKKSETERQRQAIPGLMDAPPAPRRPRFALWAAALGALLVVNVAVLGVVLTRGSAPGTAAPTGAPASLPAAAESTTAVNGPRAAEGSLPASAAAVTPAPVASPPIAPSSVASAPGAAPGTAVPGVVPSDPRHFSPMDPAPTYAPEVPPSGAAPTEVAPLAPSAHARVDRLAAEEPPRSFTHQADPVLTHADPADTEVLPSINEVNVNGRLPEMHIDLHVYAAQASERFVSINGRRYREGDTLAEGPVLERIRRDGAVLDYQGTRFLLPR